MIYICIGWVYGEVFKVYELCFTGYHRFSRCWCLCEMPISCQNMLPTKKVKTTSCDLRGAKFVYVNQLLFGLDVRGSKWILVWWTNRWYINPKPQVDTYQKISYFILINFTHTILGAVTYNYIRYVQQSVIIVRTLWYIFLIRCIYNFIEIHWNKIS